MSIKKINLSILGFALSSTILTSEVQALKADEIGNPVKSSPIRTQKLVNESKYQNVKKLPAQSARRKVLKSRKQTQSDTDIKSNQKNFRHSKSFKTQSFAAVLKEKNISSPDILSSISTIKYMIENYPRLNDNARKELLNGIMTDKFDNDSKEKFNLFWTQLSLDKKTAEKLLVDYENLNKKAKNTINSGNGDQKTFSSFLQKDQKQAIEYVIQHYSKIDERTRKELLNGIKTDKCNVGLKQKYDQVIGRIFQDKVEIARLTTNYQKSRVKKNSSKVKMNPNKTSQNILRVSNIVPKASFEAIKEILPELLPNDVNAQKRVCQALDSDKIDSNSQAMKDLARLTYLMKDLANQNLRSNPVKKMSNDIKNGHRMKSKTSGISPLSAKKAVTSRKK